MYRGAPFDRLPFWAPYIQPQRGGRDSRYVEVCQAWGRVVCVLWCRRRICIGVISSPVSTCIGTLASWAWDRLYCSFFPKTRGIYKIACTFPSSNSVSVTPLRRLEGLSVSWSDPSSPALKKVQSPRRPVLLLQSIGAHRAASALSGC
jgi:hypothetical protein